jgi:elongation factor G
VFLSTMPETSMPSEIERAIATGVQSVMDAGVLAGFPVDMKATLVDAWRHDADSAPSAFEIAARAAAREGLLKGECELLEPIMDIRVTAPEEGGGDIMSALTSRNAKGLRRTLQGDMVAIVGKAPMADMIGCVDSLRRLSRGKAVCELAFSHYAPTPPPDDGRTPGRMALRG